MTLIRCCFILLCVCFAKPCSSQINSALKSLQEIPLKYISTIDKKVDKYSHQISSKTKQTLEKLSRWENKIKAVLQKISPETVESLFGNNQPTFTSLLEQIRQGETIALSYQESYSKYRDDLHNTFNYLAEQKEQLDSGLIKSVESTRNKIQLMASEEDKTEALQVFIKERKQQIIDLSFKQIGKNKYLSKINKEAYYYVESLRNYKELFSDSRRTEELVKTILQNIPQFKQFIKNNGMLAGLFDVSSATAVLEPGMQTRAGVTQLIQNRMTSMGATAEELVDQNMAAAHRQLDNYKEALARNPLGGSNEQSATLPSFKPNGQKSKTLSQRLEYGMNLQFIRGSSFLPAGSEIALTFGYKLNDQSLLGIGMSYRMGIGSIQQIEFSHEGFGLRSFLDWKLKKQIYASGGFEMNYNQNFVDAAVLKEDKNPWQKAALIGVKKKFNLKTKFTKGTSVMIAYDFLSRQHVPISQPILFRVGYSF